MEIFQIILLAFGLSMDSLVIALTSGAIMRNHDPINIFKVAGMLAFMQFSLTVIGWLVGSTFVSYIDRYDHWLAFGILFFLGAKVLISCMKDEHTPFLFNPLNFKVMFGLGVATSIDATVVGLSMSMVSCQILIPALIIGAVTFLLSSLGIVFGCKVGQRFNCAINKTGGFLLILIACSILAQHTIFNS